MKEIIASIDVDSVSENRKLLLVHASDRINPVLILEARFEELEDLCQMVRLWDLDLRLLSKVERGKEAGALFQAQAGELHYGFCSLNANLDQFGSAPPGGLTFVIKDPEMGSLWWRGNDTSSDDVLVYQVGGELLSVSNPSFSIQTVSASRAIIDAVCASMKLKLPKASALPETFRMQHRVLAQARITLTFFRTRFGQQTGKDLQTVLEILLKAWASQANTRSNVRACGRTRDKAISRCLEFLETADLSIVTPADPGKSQVLASAPWSTRFGIGLA